MKVVKRQILKTLTSLLFIFVVASRCLADNCTLPLFTDVRHFWNGGTHTARAAVADFNNDGNLDIAATGHDNRFVGIFIGDGTGNFVRQTVLSAGTFDVPPGAGDFNNDGKQDLAVGSVDGTVWIFLGLGNGYFGSPARYADGPGYAYEMAAADFNHDNKLDLAIGHQSGALAIMLGDGQGSFYLANTYLPGLGPVKVVKSDFNNDGNVDLITANDGGTSSLLLGNGDGTFVVSNAPTVAYDANYANSGFAVGDFNHDSNIDYGTSGSGNTIVVFYGDGHGSFPTSQTFSSPANKDPHAADVDGDGNLDIVATGHPNPTAAYLLGDGTGGFGSATSFPVGNGPQGSSVADFNNDGKLDVVTPNYYGGDITVSLNNGGNIPDTSPPLITSPPDILAYATTQDGAMVSYSIIASDDSGKSPLISCSTASGSIFAIGSTAVTCTATDPCGHTATASFNVTVVDQPPVLSLPNSVYATATVSSGAVVNYSVSATDVVSGTLPVTCTPASGSNFPIGQTTVSCSATDGAGHTSTGSFNVNVSGCIGCTLPTFAGASYPLAFVAQETSQLIAADFNNDGKPDLAESPGLSGSGTEGIAIYLNNGSGGFVAPIFVYPYYYYAQAFAVADFNHDGKLDIVAATDNVLEILHGDGTGHFSQAGIIDLESVGPSYGGVNSIVISDLNNDHHPDVFVSLQLTSSVFLGNGYTLDPNSPWNNGPGNPSYSLNCNAADFNQDGNADVLTGGFLMLGDGTGNLTGLSIPDDVSLNYGAVGDFNGDHNPDVASRNVTVYLGDGAGGSASRAYYQVGVTQPSDIGAADINGDGTLDLVAIGSGQVFVLLGDGNGVFGSVTSLPGIEFGRRVAIADFNGDGKPDIAETGNTVIDQVVHPQLKVFLNTTYQTPVGSNSTVTVNNTTFTFDEVTTGGTTTVTPIDPASVGEVPGGFSVSNSVAYEIATTATFTGSVTLAIKVPGPISEEDFNALAILHNENGTLVDVTASTPARNYSTLTIYATTTSFSPFYLARRGTHIKSLFDQSRAYKRGSTIPIKLQVLNASNANASSANASLFTRDLRLMNGNTLAPIEDSGHANPDYAFRYDPTLGGAGGGYIFNLSTRGLAPGQYVLSFYVGSERSFFYTVKFEVK